MRWLTMLYLVQAWGFNFLRISWAFTLIPQNSLPLCLLSSHTYSIGSKLFSLKWIPVYLTQYNISETHPWLANHSLLLLGRHKKVHSTWFHLDEVHKQQNKVMVIEIRKVIILVGYVEGSWWLKRITIEFSWVIRILHWSGWWLHPDAHPSLYLVNIYVKMYQDVQLRFMCLPYRNFKKKCSVLDNKLYGHCIQRRLFSTKNLSRHYAS